MSDTAVMGVIEFGATARGDADQFSDKDIFAVVEDVDVDVLDRLRLLIAADYATTPGSVACYSASSFDQMITHGSLFTWHLRLEGKILSDTDGVLAEAFANLTPYDAFAADIDRFSEIYADVCEAYIESNILDTFERHVLFIIARNVCMLLTTLRGQPTFGRRTVIAEARRLYPELPFSTPVAEWLASGHLAYVRNLPLEMSDSDSIKPERIMHEIEHLLHFAAKASNADV